MPGAVELTVRHDGTVICDWWRPEVAEYICDLCGCHGGESCKKEINGLMVRVCVNIDPYCG